MSSGIFSDYVWELCGLAADVCVVGLLQWGLNNSLKTTKLIEDSPSYLVGNELKEAVCSSNGVLPYVCISGIVQPQTSALHSHYKGKEQGVIQKLTLVEHHTKRQQGFWQDCRRVVREATNYAPFKLVSPESRTGIKTDTPQVEVFVQEPLKADSLMDNLNTTFDKFTPNKSTALERSIDRVFGDVSKGFQETEQMLTTGVYMLGIGKVSFSRNGLMLSAPDDEHSKYLLTQLSKDEVLRIFKSRTKFFRVVKFIFTLTGFCLGTYIAYQIYKKWKANKEMKVMIEEFRAGNTNTGEDGDDDTNQNCIICLTEERNVILLECGHVCVCSSCAQLIPSPKTCPICRNNVTKILPIYHS